MKADPGKKRLNRLWMATALVALALIVVAASALPTHAAARPEDQAPPQRFEGYLKAQGPDKWLIGDFSVLVDQRTALNEKRGPATIGAWLIVWVNSDANAGLRAELIFVDRPAGQSGPMVQFTNRLNKQSGAWWVIGDTLVQITPETTLIGDPRVGHLVWVMADPKSPDLLCAVIVESVAATPENVPVEFEGAIAQVGVAAWQVDGRQVMITEETAIWGDAAVGKSAEVKAVQAQDGTLTAHIIRVVDQTDELTLGVLVAAILPTETGATVWDVLLFSGDPGAYPTPTTIYVNGNTLVDESRAVAKAGQWAEVRGLPVGQGEFKADMIRLEEPVPVTIAGDAELVSDETAAGAWWRIAGQRVWVSRQVAATVVDPQRKEGAAIQGLLLGNGVVWVRQLQAPQSGDRGNGG
ncbi:MAG: hypothetical protein CVU38_15140 [Chloroflexi bacterium HGW-Chloroflexi-1]|nr:MAG: hypothetical protein CVU38_15140 [Chloroflexi bacterium HGW-Chloroflexi-1]